MRDGGPLDLSLPRYGAASLADLLPSCLAVLGVPGEPDVLDLGSGLDGVRRIAVLVVDGLGWHQLPAAAPYAATLADLAAGRLGSARALTCGLPSTTPASLVTIGTGRPPGTHGVIGFTLRVPGTDRVLNHLTWRDDPDPTDWQPCPTAFERAASAGFATTVVSRKAYAGSGLTVAAYRGAEYLGVETTDQLVGGVLASLRRHRLVYAYHPDVDHAGHRTGVDSGHWRSAVGSLDRLLTRLIDGLPPDAALIVTADHGQLDVPADARADLAADDRLLDGVTVVAGEARMRYLHTVPGAADDIAETWRGVLGDRVEVLHRAEAVARGWFGPVAGPHLARIGDLVVASRGRFAVLSTGSEPVSVTTMVGFHGSYTALEMEVPLLIAKIVGGRG
jgi:hypothetical protein